MPFDSTASLTDHTCVRFTCVRACVRTQHMLALPSAGTGASRVHILALCEARRFLLLVSGFWFLVSGFWFLVLGFVHTHVLCDARREAAIGHLLPEILKRQRHSIITLYSSNCIMTFQSFCLPRRCDLGVDKDGTCTDQGRSQHLSAA